MTQTEREQIISLVKREVIPAIGCTEPVAVALAVAKAKEVLGIVPDTIQVFLSANVLKNAMGVGIPGTGMIGLPIAIALGALVGKSAYQLEVLKDCTPEMVEEGKKMIEEKRIDICLKEGNVENLYIEAVCKEKDNNSIVVISGDHTRFTYISHNDDIILTTEKCKDETTCEEKVELNLRKVYDFALTTPLEEIRFILKSAELNRNAAEEAFKNDYGHSLGNTIKDAKEKTMMGNGLFSHILSFTCAACDARMAGAMIPVMSNSGSGNQGIAATLPVVMYAEHFKKSEEELIRALMLSHLTVIYIKQSLGRLSAFCGCVVAATGSSCGITYLMGGTYQQITFAVKNMIANLTGMICDGAKPSCALKLTSGVSTAVFSAMMAMECKCVSSVEGIIDEDVDKSIRNLTLIASEGMTETNKLVLKIMTEK